ncbi:MAG TPA: RidA family protein [Prolixibacteraceae bacterium]|nr:RidA family protein [Prolixibacteraceae bacterium]
MKRTLTLLALLFMLAVTNAYCQSSSLSIKKEKFNIDKQGEDNIGYTQAIKVGNTIYISGSVGWGNMKDALKLAYDEIDKTLKYYNATFKNVVKENLYSTALDSVIANKNIRLQYYGTDYPAATWVEVKRLYNEGLVVEIEVTAVLPEEK